MRPDPGDDARSNTASKVAILNMDGMENLVGFRMM